jgi:ribosomal protein L37E
MAIPQNQPRKAIDETWACPHCGASNEATFAACWRCGTASDGTPDPDFAAAVVPTQSRDRCRNCDYPLYGLTTERCPECGTPFDPEARDTPWEPAAPDPHAERTRREALYLWLATWILLPLTGLVYGACDYAGIDVSTWPYEPAFNLSFLLLGAGAVISPIMFVFRMFK